MFLNLKMKLLLLRKKKFTACIYTHIKLFSNCEMSERRPSIYLSQTLNNMFSNTIKKFNCCSCVKRSKRSLFVFDLFMKIACNFVVFIINIFFRNKKQGKYPFIHFLINNIKLIHVG